MTDTSVFSNLLQELWMSSIYGIPEGHPLDVPLGFCSFFG